MTPGFRTDLFSRAGLLGIYIYQRLISPYKGFRCAYSRTHGGTGCSGYAKQAIRDVGLFKAIPKIRARFTACKTASMNMNGAIGDELSSSKKRKRNRRSGNNNKWYDNCDLGGADCGGCDLGW